MRVLGIVVARGGSKGIPRKNVKLLAGKPLLQYTAEAALGTKHLTRVVLSTEDEEIAEVGRRCGLAVPFMRPRELAGDEIPTLPVLQHAVRELEEKGERYEAICLLQPTHPLRRPQDIDACITTLERQEVDTVITVLPVPYEYNPHWVYFQDHHGLLRLCTGELNPVSRRQDLPPAFHREGSVYVTRRDVLMKGDTLYGNRVLGYLMDAERSLNIDTPEDWQRAELIFQSKTS